MSGDFGLCVLFVRHGERQHGNIAEPLDPLTEQGEQAIRDLSAMLSDWQFRPDAFFTSSYVHAHQTSELLAQGLSKSPIIKVDALTPHTEEASFSFENITEAAKRADVNLDSVKIIALVGHESRLSQLVARATSSHIYPLGHSEAICVVAKNFYDLHYGHGSVSRRIANKSGETSETTSRGLVMVDNDGFILLGGSSIMDVLDLLSRAVRTCAPILKFGAGIQTRERERLIAEFKEICDNCEEAHSIVIKRLRPIKDAFSDTAKLAKELRDFAVDSKTRTAFKPDHLCGQIDNLLSDLENNLDPLKYSVDVRKLKILKTQLGVIGHYDAVIYDAYDEFTRDLDNLGTDLQIDANQDVTDRVYYARHLIEDFEENLSSTIQDVRNARSKITGVKLE